MDIYGRAEHAWTNPGSGRYLPYADYHSFESLKGFLRDTFQVGGYQACQLDLVALNDIALSKLPDVSNV